jgi:hypothetical protein
MFSFVEVALCQFRLIASGGGPPGPIPGQHASAQARSPVLRHRSRTSVVSRAFGNGKPRHGAAHECPGLIWLGRPSRIPRSFPQGRHLADLRSGPSYGGFGLAGLAEQPGLVWIAGIFIVFIPLAVRAYRRAS